MTAVDEFISNYGGEKREWLTTMVAFMRENFPEAREVISYGMPMFKFGNTYIAFSVAKDHFTFHTLDFEMIEELKTRLPRAKFGRGSAKVPYGDQEAIPILFETCRKIASRAK